MRTRFAIPVDLNDLPSPLLVRDLLFYRSIVRSETPVERGRASFFAATHTKEA